MLGVGLRVFSAFWGAFGVLYGFRVLGAVLGFWWLEFKVSVVRGLGVLRVFSFSRFH